MAVVSKGGESSGMSDGMLFGTRDTSQLARERQMMNESLVKSREEQQEFDNKMMQVTNLLKELKNNSSSGHTGFTSNPPTL